MKKVLGIREKVFALICLFIMAVLCIVRFAIAFARESNLMSEITKNEYVDEAINFGGLNYMKVILIAMFCFAILLLLCSFVYLFVKSVNAKRGIILVAMAVLLLSMTFFFIGRFICEDHYSKAIWLTDNYEREALCDLGEEFLQNSIYLIFGLITSIVMHFVSFSLSNDYLEDKADSEEKGENVETGFSEEEKVLNEEISKLKAKIKIKDLESEYLKLKSQLDE